MFNQLLNFEDSFDRHVNVLLTLRNVFVVILEIFSEEFDCFFNESRVIIDIRNLNKWLILVLLIDSEPDLKNSNCPLVFFVFPFPFINI